METMLIVIGIVLMILLAAIVRLLEAQKRFVYFGLKDLKEQITVITRNLEYIEAQNRSLKETINAIKDVLKEKK